MKKKEEEIINLTWTIRLSTPVYMILLSSWALEVLNTECMAYIMPFLSLQHQYSPWPTHGDMARIGLPEWLCECQGAVIGGKPSR